MSWRAFITSNERNSSMDFLIGAILGVIIVLISNGIGNEIDQGYVVKHKSARDEMEKNIRKGRNSR